MRDLPRVIGHRGAAARAPENTLAGFRKAAEIGVRWVEFDVRLTLDGRPVVIHDSRLDRTTDGTGAVAATAFADLRARDAGAWFDAAYRGETVPSLEEVLDLCRRRGLAFDLEMKADAGNEAALAEAVWRTLDRVWPREAPPPLVTSFEPPALVAFGRLAPGIPRGYLVEALPPDWLAEARRLDVAAVITAHRRLDRDLVRAVKSAGYPLLAYTVNHPSRAETLFGWGVDAVFSDAPDAVL